MNTTDKAVSFFFEHAGYSYPTGSNPGGTETMKRTKEKDDRWRELLRHVGHEIECVTYGDQENVSVECATCCEVIESRYIPPDVRNA